MASENKRQSAVPKVPVALPKTDAGPSPSQLVSQETALHAAVGSRVRVSTVAPNQSTVEGTIYVADPTTNLLILNVSPAPNTTISASTLHAPTGSYRIIPISQISSFQLQALPQADPSSPPPVQSVNSLDTAALQARLQRQMTALQSQQLRQGPKGTSPADQALFDSLSRTHPAQWHGNAMIISETFIVDKPYQPANVRLLNGAGGDLDRMRKVLDMERKKIDLKTGKEKMDGRLLAEGSLMTAGRGAGVKKGG